MLSDCDGKCNTVAAVATIAAVSQVFFAAVGASANVPLVIRTAPVLFCYSFIALAGHLLLLLGLGRLAGFSLRDLLLASNANIGGEGAKPPMLWEGLGQGGACLPACLPAYSA